MRGGAKYKYPSNQTVSINPHLALTLAVDLLPLLAHKR